MAEENITKEVDVTVTDNADDSAEKEVEISQEVKPKDEAEWQKRHPSPEHVFEENKKLQSKLAKLESKLAEHDLQLNTKKDDPEKRLGELAQDPDGFVDSKIDNRLADLKNVKAMMAINDFVADNPEFKPYKSEIIDQLGGNLAALENREVVEMVFVTAQYREQKRKSDKGLGLTQKYKDKITDIKAKETHLEDSSKSKPNSPKTIKPGMSVAEMNKILDERGETWHKTDT